MIESITEESLNKIKLPHVEGNTNTEWPGWPGKSHYHFLSYISNLYNDITIINISHDRLSDCAFSTNKTNKIITITDIIGINTHIILSSKIVFIDIEPHDGIKEFEIYCYFRDNNYEGILIFDDIWYFKGMRDNLWYKIPSYQKFDITKFTHWSGTGLVKLTSQPDINYMPNNSYTFVTGYFDLTNYDDASPEIKARPSSFYLQCANTTMSINTNLVIFTEEKFKDDLEKLRPEYLKHKTKFILCKFEDFPLHKYREKIKENRNINPTSDPRNTVSYYLCCMTRYQMVKIVTELNPFNTTHFGWCDLGIERQGFRNCASFENVLSCFRDKVSACYIDYIPQTLINNVKDYYKWGRCSIASGFFTGKLENINLFCKLINEKFIYYVEQGFGHADEQLFSPVYFENKDLFDFYFGDYKSIITNYCYIKEDINSILDHLISNSFHYQNYQLCYLSCKSVWNYCFALSNTKILNNKQINFLNKFLICCVSVKDWDMASSIIIEFKNNT